MVRVLQTLSPPCLPQPRRLGQAALAQHPAQAAGRTRSRSRSRLSTLVQCLLPAAGSLHHVRGPCPAHPLSTRDPSTGEPYAGDPHVRFGGRGSSPTLPTPIGVLV